MTAKQQELAKRCEIKAQRECKRLQICQLAQEGSKTDEREGFPGDDQYGINDDDDEDDGSQREIAGSDDDNDEEPRSTPHSSSNRQSTQHRKSKDRHFTSSTPPEAEGVLTVEDERNVMMAPTSKQHWESSKEDILEATVVKAQKLVEHEGRPCTRDYDDMTQEFMVAVIGEYRAHLCAEAPMPDHVAEMSLLDASWVQACKSTGVNLYRSPQLVTSRGSQAIFGFHSSESKSMIKKNRSLAEGLKDGSNFAFKHMSADKNEWRGFLKAPLIQKIINMIIHSGMAPLTAPTEVTVSVQIIATAIKEHEEGSTMEDESD
ncbi:hypothetical protein EDD15DRAFT_2359536 [Pisolithus albus]|nr:hypothetical protein EDD15DRAFT_2359536 [Pisolithus albus]